MPEVRVRVGGAHRFLPSGAGLVFLKGVEYKDFWLVDLVTNKITQLTDLADHGFLNTFDITPDGKYLVFDRTRQNSDIVLIDLPRKVGRATDRWPEWTRLPAQIQPDAEHRATWIDEDVGLPKSRWRPVRSRGSPSPSPPPPYC